MKKHSKEAVFIATAALLLLPVQQMLIKNAANDPSAPAVQKQTEQDWSSSALSGNAGGVMNMVFFNLRRNNTDAAIAWLEFGTMNLQAPSVMLFYGDWLNQRGQSRRAKYFYRFALKKAKMQNAPKRFIDELKKRLGGEL